MPTVRKIVNPDAPTKDEGPTTTSHVAMPGMDSGEHKNVANPQDLPSGWVWTTLGIVSSKIQDGTHFSPQVQYDQATPGRYLYITAKNIKESGVDLSDVKYINEELHRSIYARCNPEPGDVLLIKDGVKTGIATVNRIQEQFSLLSSITTQGQEQLF